MKTPDETKKGVEYLSIKDITKKLDAWKEGISYDYAEDAAADALAYIRQLERERDAAVRDMYEAQGLLCLICKNHSPDPELKKYVCKEFGERYPEDGIIICGKFEWRGVKEDDHAQTY